VTAHTLYPHGLASAYKRDWQERAIGLPFAGGVDGERACLVSDDEANQSASKDAFELLHLAAAKRLARRRFTVIDATNVQPEGRKQVLGTRDLPPVDPTEGLRRWRTEAILSWLPADHLRDTC
jgi:hypothetical protein